MARGGLAVRRGVTTWVVTLLVASGATAAVSIPDAERRGQDRVAAAKPAPVRPAASDRAEDLLPSTTVTAADQPAPADAAASTRIAGPTRATLPVGRLQAVVDEFIAARPDIGSVAVGVALAESGSVPWFGGNHPGLAEPYGVLSITKTFTEALVLREAAIGRIDLDAPVPQLPGVVPTPAGVVITPRMLLQHTSGLVNYMSAVGYDATATVTPAELVSLSLKSPLLAPPGTKASYSNTNFHWLGLLLEHATGRTFADLLSGLAIEVGLPDTALDPTGRPGWIGYASGGVRSTVPDVTRWAAALFTPDRVLGAAELEALTTLGPQGVSHGLWPTAGGLGQLVAHGGVVHYPAERLVVVVRIDPATAKTGVQTSELAAGLRAAVVEAGLTVPTAG